MIILQKKKNWIGESLFYYIEFRIQYSVLLFCIWIELFIFVKEHVHFRNSADHYCHEMLQKWISKGIIIILENITLWKLKFQFSEKFIFSRVEVCLFNSSVFKFPIVAMFFFPKMNDSSIYEHAAHSLYNMYAFL